ncbi:MAG: hypothetical protein JNK28_10405 [Burkholderiaceae bacterium]|nr:hypothetical protein [Burkholderiaceae bacterium]
MVIPVAQECIRRGLAEVEVLALTSAAATARAAGLKVRQFRDFVRGDDAPALRWGEELARTMESGGSVEPEETRAYLGLSFADMVSDVGEEEAWRRYRAYGRHQFFPVRTMERILAQVEPSLVVITNSPRAERAAGVAARRLGVPALCINSMFAIDEIAWLSESGFCSRLCVLNEEVRRRFIDAGRRAEEVVVTGNPSFDALVQPRFRATGETLRLQFPSGTREIVLWASQPEYRSHPTAPGLVGDPLLPAYILTEMLTWADAAPGRHLIIRPHPNESIDDPSRANATLLTTRDCDIAVALNACDVVATMTSTVALQAHALGLPVVQVRGSIFDHSMPLAAMGIAAECRVSEVLPTLESVFARRSQAQAGDRIGLGGATAAVVDQISALLAPGVS